MANKTEVLQIDTLAAAFREVCEDMGAKVSRRMVVAGGKIIREEAKAVARANGSVITSAMVDNIVIKRETKAPDGTAQYHIGVRHGRNQTRKVRAAGNRRLVVSRGRITQRRDNDPFYWRFVERGHRLVPASVDGGESTYTQRLRNGTVVTRKRRFSGKSLRARRRMAGEGVVGKKPFIAPALQTKRDAAITEMERTLQRYLARERKKGGA